MNTFKKKIVCLYAQDLPQFFSIYANFFLTFVFRSFYTERWYEKFPFLGSKR